MTCYATEYHRKRDAVWDLGWRVGVMMTHAKQKIQKSKKKNRFLEIDITHADLMQLYVKQFGICVATGQPLNLVGRQHDTVSLDRINCDVGYVIGNVQLTTQQYNISRQDNRIKDFAKMCADVAKHAGLI